MIGMVNVLMTTQRGGGRVSYGNGCPVRIN